MRFQEKNYIFLNYVKVSHLKEDFIFYVFILLSRAEILEAFERNINLIIKVNY